MHASSFLNTPSLIMAQECYEYLEFGRDYLAWSAFGNRACNINLASIKAVSENFKKPNSYY